MDRWWHMWTGRRPPLPADEIRRRRRETVIIVLTAVVFLVFAVFETRLAGLSNIVFFLLINFNLILLVLLIFLVTRNVVKLVFERRRGIFGSRLRTRLVLAFVGLSLVPSVLLFFVAEGFLNAAIENWFNVRVESSLEGSLDVAQSYYQFAANNALHFAREVGQQTSEQGLWPPGRHADLQSFVQRKLEELNLAGLEVFSANDTGLARADSTETAQRPPPIEAEVRTELSNGQEVTRTYAFGRGDIVRAGVPVRGKDGAIIGAVTVDYLVPRNVSKKARDISRSYEEYRQLSGMKQPIKNGYVLSLALITLVVTFSATWFGIQQAKSITIPLQRLAEGTREVAQGNWDYRIEAGSDEETAVLVDSFNQMTAELQQIHSELVERRKYVENLLANITAGVVSLSHTGAVTMLNRAAEGMLGLRLTQARGKHWAQVFERLDLRKIAEVIDEALGSPDASIERQIKLTGGEHIVTALVSTTALTDDTGTPRGLMLFFEDVTHLLRVQRMEAWREVARRLAHEIKNPLTPIQLSAQRLRKRYAAQLAQEDGTLFDECTRTIIGQVDELKRLVNEFSMFARLPAVALAPQDLNAVVDETLALFRQGHTEVAFEYRPAEGLPPIELDREAIKRALINMLDNAVAACQGIPERGRVEIVVSHLRARGIVRLEVADNGMGMSRDAKLRLFEPYFSTKKEGTGLGLAIVSAIVADHQAYIHVRDNQPRGSRFIIDFPLRRPSEITRVAARA
ncbi:MAG: ATP-binding protein [Candidatus Binatia bacterium]|jgi:two-component system, NtrC family, nitrogen regulation sensor histidine kinase NtrY